MPAAVSKFGTRTAAQLRVWDDDYRTLSGVPRRHPEAGAGAAPKRRYRRSHGSSEVHHARIAGVHVPRTAQDGGGFCKRCCTYQGDDIPTFQRFGAFHIASPTNQHHRHI